MRFLFLLFAVCAFAAPKHAPKHFSDDQPQKEKGIYLDESEIEEARMLIKLTDTILHGSDLTRDGNLEQAAKKAEAASRIAAKLVKNGKPGVTREDADALKQAAEEAEKAAAADDEKGVQEAISAMEYQLEKILENIEDLIKEKEEQMGFSKHTATEQADVPLTADSEAMTDLEAAANQTVHGDTMIPHEHKEKAINYTTKSAKEGFHQANTTNGKLKKLSENEENWEEERPHHHRYHLYGSEHNKTCKSRRFNWHRCKHHFGHRFCRRMFFRRFLHHRGFHHFFHHHDEDYNENHNDQDRLTANDVYKEDIEVRLKHGQTVDFDDNGNMVIHRADAIVGPGENKGRISKEGDVWKMKGPALSDNDREGSITCLGIIGITCP